jgi:hypothetical protein
MLAQQRADPPPPGKWPFKKRGCPGFCGLFILGMYKSARKNVFVMHIARDA